MPLTHHFEEGVVLEEGDLLELHVVVVVADELVEGHQFALADHAVAADGDVVVALLALGAHLVLVDALHPHVEELLRLRPLQHRHNLGDVQDLVAQQVGDGVVDRLPRLHLHRRQHLYRPDPLPHLPHVQQLLRRRQLLRHMILFGRKRFGDGLFLQRRQFKVSDGTRSGSVEYPLPALFGLELGRSIPGEVPFDGDGGLEFFARGGLDGLEVDVEPVAEPLFIMIPALLHKSVVLYRPLPATHSDSNQPCKGDEC